MKKIKAASAGFRLPALVILCVVRWYHRFNLSLRDIGELLLERGMVVTCESIRQWCGRFRSQFTCGAKAARARPGSTWHLDEMAVRLCGEPHWLWRAVDGHGTELDGFCRNKAVGHDVRNKMND